MKKLCYLFLCFTIFISGIHAQDCSDAIATAVPTPSTCMSNGSITITWSGASAGNLVEKQYSLKSTTGSLAIGPVSSNVFNNLPPGNYNLEAAAFCGSLSGAEVVRTINNVTVGGSYKEPRLSFVAAAATSTAAVPTSRNSYVGCSTGLIVLFLENGDQTTMPTFTITSAPAGVTVPQAVTATRATSGSVASGWRYILNNTWPAGTYTVSANDGCYTASISFKIEEITAVYSGLFGSSTANFYTYGDGTDCSKVYYQPYYSYSSTSNPDWYRYFIDGLYEYGIAPTGEMPKEENWFRIRYNGSSASYRDLIDLSPGKVSDYYAANSLTIYTRVKGCPSAITSIPAYNQNNSIFTSTTNNCTGTRTYRYNYLKTNYPYYHVYCYPLTITVTDQTSGNVLYNNANYLFTDPDFYWDCEFGKNQYLNITDASGYKIQTNYAMSGVTPTSTKPSISLNAITSWPEYNNCDSYMRSYSTSAGTPCENQSFYPCYVTITDDSNNVIKLDTLMTTGSKRFDDFQYGVTYTFTYLYPNWDNYTTQTTMNLTRSTYIASSYTLSKYNNSLCKENYGSLIVNSGFSQKCFKAGTTITVTGPAGYIGQSYTYLSNTTNTTNGYYYTFPETYLPAGEYTATITACGETYTAKANVTEGYTVNNFSHTLEQDCMGTNLFPSGSISSNQVPMPAVYFRMISAPQGTAVTNKVIASTSNDYFALTTAGTYILGMMASNSLSGCAIKLDTIYHNPMPLALDRDKTSAYSCPGGSTGYLTLQATNGVLPYTYSVYDEANTTLLHGPVTSSSAIDLGSFGEANKTYTVRMSDLCGNSFNQQVTLVSLDRTALAYGQELVCYASPISIFGFTVTNATYSWTGPNGFTSTLKNPVIPNATPVDGGWYYVDIHSLACNITVRDSIFISVYDPVIPNEVNGKTQEVILCPYQVLRIGQAATGGSGKASYQWAYSNNNGANWYNLTGQTSSTLIGNSTAYMYTSTTANPTYKHLRLAVNDEDCGIYYLYYRTSAKACMFLVNPDLKSPGSEN